jgi:hypothetical protein
MTKLNNIFTVDSVVIEGDYIKVTGKYQEVIPGCLPFERGDILTEDKYQGHQIYVSFATKDENGIDGLVLDTKSMHPNIKKPLDTIFPELHLFKIED